MKILIITLNLLYGSDAGVTRYALSHHLAHEILLPTQNPYVVMVVTDSEAMSTSLGISWLDKNDHPKLARVIGWTIVGIRGFVVGHNVMELRRVK